mgnify:CR=1 FL=1
MRTGWLIKSKVLFLGLGFLVLGMIIACGSSAPPTAAVAPAATAVAVPQAQPVATSAPSVVATGTPEDVARMEESYTGQYLRVVLGITGNGGGRRRPSRKGAGARGRH